MIERILRWYRVKRVCCWCSRPHWIGGNPFARKVTHGVCVKARDKMLAEIRRPA